MAVGRFVAENYPNHPWSFDRRILYIGPFWYAYTFYDYSSFISVFLALVRCLCVARPLRFKSIFTTFKIVKILVVLVFVALTLRAPVVTIFRLTSAANPLTNSTYRSLGVTENFKRVYKINDIINRNIVSLVAYIIVTTCVIIIVSKLQAASKFRRYLLIASHVGSTLSDNAAGQMATSHWAKVRNRPTICLQRICRLFNLSY